MATEAGSPKVIIAVDDSPQAYAAFEYYFKFLHRPDNEVIVTHCIEFPYVPYQPMRQEVLQDLLEKAKKNASAVDDKYKQRLQATGAKGEFISEFGHPGHYIVDKAKEKNACLVIMGTRGMGTIRRTVMGSVSDYVLHHCHCPVMIHRS